jgi:hypothetical protein
LRKPQDPLDPSNRRISLIVQYLQKPHELLVPKNGESPKTPGAKPESKPDAEHPKTVESKRENH